MRNIMFVLHISLMLSSSLFSQNPSDEWYYGRIILQEGDTLYGTMQVELQHSILKLKTDDNRIKTFSAQQVKHFSYYDTFYKVKRLFSTIPARIKNDYWVASFFGVIVDNTENISLYYKTYHNNQGLLNTKTLFFLDYELFIKNANDEIRKYKGTKKSLFELLPSYHEQIAAFIAHKSLNIAAPYDMGQIIEYYNSLQAYSLQK